MFSHNFLPRILASTRLASGSATLIDNIFLIPEMFETVSGNITASLSDQLPQFIFIKDFFNQNTQPQFKIVRDFKKCNFCDFFENIGQLNWEEIFQINTSEDISRGFKTVIDNITGVLDNYAPIKSTKINKGSIFNKPLINKDIQKSIINRDKFHKKNEKLKNPASKHLLWEEYKRYRNTLTELICKSKITNYHSFFEKHKSDLKKP